MKNKNQIASTKRMCILLVNKMKLNIMWQLELYFMAHLEISRHNALHRIWIIAYENYEQSNVSKF